MYLVIQWSSGSWDGKGYSNLNIAPCETLEDAVAHVRAYGGYIIKTVELRGVIEDAADPEAKV